MDSALSKYLAFDNAKYVALCAVDSRHGVRKAACHSAAQYTCTCVSAFSDASTKDKRTDRLHNAQLSFGAEASCHCD